MLKGVLDKNVAVIGLAFSFTLAACTQAQPEPAAYCYEDNYALLSGALGVDGQGKNRGVFIAHYQMGSGTIPFFLVGYEENQTSLVTNNRRVRELCDWIRKGETIKTLGPKQ